MISLFQAAYALETPTYYSEHTEGWYWYHDPIKNPTKGTSDSISGEENPAARMNQLHQMANEALDKAFFNPSDKNVKEYMALQDLISRRATVFAARWKEVLLNHPDLDYSIQHPTTSQGRAVYLAKYTEKEDQAIREFAKSKGLFFFYRGDCPYCHRFAPILKAFAEQYQLHVIPISLGAGFLPEFPNSRTDEGQAALLHVTVYPSVFAVDPKTQKIVPISYGLMTYEALRERFLDIVTQFRGDLS